MPEKKDKPERQRSHRNRLAVELGDERVSGGRQEVKNGRYLR